jgi:4a-hydroxytetrahydrobiopterin dehydratase
MTKKPLRRRLTAIEIAEQLRTLSGWTRKGGVISKTYVFKNYYEAVAFVNATAWISHRADHHPDIVLGYKQCEVAYTSHDVGGLSARDFACAAKVDSLFTL